MSNLQERCAELCEWCAGSGVPNVEFEPIKWAKRLWLHRDRDTRPGYPVHRECRASHLREEESSK